MRKSSSGIMGMQSEGCDRLACIIQKRLGIDMDSPCKAAIWETEPVRDERIFDIKHKAILNSERRIVT